MHENEATPHEAENEAEANNYVAENEVEAVKFGLGDLTSLVVITVIIYVSMSELSFCTDLLRYRCCEVRRLNNAGWWRGRQELDGRYVHPEQ